MDDSGWRKVAKEADIAENTPLVVEAGEEKILLVRLRGTFHAVGHECSHYQEKLEKGILFGSQIVCKSHFARFDVTTGRVISPPAANDLPVYPVKVKNGDVWVGQAVKPKFPKPAAALGSDPRTFLVIGGGAAGNTAAETLRRQGFAGRIVMVTEESERPYDRPNLSKDFITGAAGEEWLPLRGPKFYAAQGIELLTGQRVVSLDAEKKAVRLAGGDAILFDKALLATGGTPRALAVPGGEGCLFLRTTADARAILAAAARSSSVVIIGAGFIGLELASSLRERGLAVTVVAPSALPLARLLGDRIGAFIMSLHQAKGVKWCMDRTVSRIEEGAGGKTVILSDGTRLSAGFVVAGVGIRPAVDYLSSTDLVENGAVPVDERMQTRAAGIFAAGDIAALPDEGGGRRRVEHWVAAERQGQRAALCMLGGDPGPFEVDVFWSRQAGVSVKYAGHAPDFDQIVYRGAVEEGKFLAGYYRGGVLKAAATVGMALELVAVERLLRLGTPLVAARLGDAGFDLVAAAQGA
ncbi:MAG: FAD-dependent oxidoreductase [Spirochaetia bacterium]|jgi:NADPH-dependent 2,4-dienoyl-CoA reductase/sulfur reductase-like enzyme/nitrite reductase/ring-hydroxylating ferredoxin subunit